MSADAFEIQSCVMLTSDGQAVDLTNLLLELHLYEDVFSSTVSGSAVLADSLDILSKFSVHGNEYLAIAVDKPGLNMPIEKVFRLYSVKNITYDATWNVNYNLFFASEELLVASQIKISKSYRGMLISDMVRDICLNVMKIPESRLFVEPTEGAFDLIVPNLDPLEAINWLRNMAYADGKSLYLFFENRDGFHFISYDTLIATESYAEYALLPKLGRDPADNAFLLDYYNVPVDFNLLTGIRYGAYSSRFLRYDYTNRTFDERLFTAAQDSIHRLNPFLTTNEAISRTGTTLYDSCAGVTKFMMGNDSERQSQHWFQRSMTKLAELTNAKSIAVAPGDVLLKAGAVVSLLLPSFVSQGATFDRNALKSGRYFVSAVNHKFQKNTYTTTMELLRDSYAEQLPDPVESPAITKARSL